VKTTEIIYIVLYRASEVKIRYGWVCNVTQFTKGIQYAKSYILNYYILTFEKQLNGLNIILHQGNREREILPFLLKVEYKCTRLFTCFQMLNKNK